MKTDPEPFPVNTVGTQRATLSFSVEGLAAREELLFKGYVRLLDHMTDHRWQYREPSALQRVDLLVADERVKPTVFLYARETTQPVLLLGTSGPSRPSFLSWPLKPGELENELNRLGDLIQAQDAHEHPAQASDAMQNTVPAPLERTPEPAEVQSDRQYRLRQWPRPILLSQPGRMRLATLLTGRAMSLDEMVFRSALPRKVCERFVEDMQTAGLVLHPDAADSQTTAWVPPAARKPRLPAQNERQAAQAAPKSVI